MVESWSPAYAGRVAANAMAAHRQDYGGRSPEFHAGDVDNHG
ncbi:hypothetical protein [Hamadaea sp.]|nr:hypothetical protein [Hamadaea sp.]